LRIFVVGEHMAHAVARGRRSTARTRRALPADCSPSTWAFTASNTLASGWAPLRREIAPLPGAGVDDRCRAFRRRERREAREPGAVEALAPFGLGKIEPVRRQRLVRRPGAPRGAPGAMFLGARLIVIGDLGEALFRGVFGERLDHHRCAREIIEQGVEVVMEQRQPVFHAGIAAAFAHRCIEQIVSMGCTEGLHIAGAEAADGLGGELEFGDRHEIERVELVLAALGLRIEGADRFQRVAEEIEPHRIGYARRKTGR